MKHFLVSENGMGTRYAPSKWAIVWDPPLPHGYSFLCYMPRGSMTLSPKGYWVEWFGWEETQPCPRTTEPGACLLTFFSLYLLTILMSVLIKPFRVESDREPNGITLSKKENLFYHEKQNKTGLASHKVGFGTQTLSICFSALQLFLLLPGLHSQVFSLMETTLVTSHCNFIILPYICIK